jgi:hypothetical protein
MRLQYEIIGNGLYSLSTLVTGVVEANPGVV